MTYSSQPGFDDHGLTAPEHAKAAGLHQDAASALAQHAKRRAKRLAERLASEAALEVARDGETVLGV
jgi:hypothetical protein